MYSLRFYENDSICTQQLKAFHLNFVIIHARILPKYSTYVIFCKLYRMSLPFYKHNSVFYGLLHYCNTDYKPVIFVMKSLRTTQHSIQCKLMQCTAANVGYQGKQLQNHLSVISGEREDIYQEITSVFSEFMIPLF